MNKKIKLLLILSLFLSDVSFASLYWSIENGISEYRRNNFKSAKNAFIHYINNNPNDNEGYYWLGLTNLKLKDNKTATENFEKSYNIFINEKNIDSINFKEEKIESINDYLDIAKTYFDDGNYKEADYYADMILKIDSKSAYAYFIKAKIAQINNNVELAKEYLNKAITFDNRLLKTNLAKKLNITSIPKLKKEECLNLLYNAYFQGDVNKAIQLSKVYLTMDNTDSEMYNMLARLYYLNGSVDLAKETLQEAKKINDKNIKTYILEAEFGDEKEKKLLKGFEINPNNQELLLALGNYYLKNQDYDNAKKYFSSLVSLNDNFYEGYFGYILCLIKKGDEENALKYLRKASLLNPNQSELTILLAELCILQFKYSEALEYIDESISKEENPYYYLLRAKINYTLKKYNDSLKDIEKIRYSFDNREVKELYMLNLLKKQDYQNIENFLIYSESSLDKNSLIYKYILYKIYQNNNDKNRQKIQYAKVFSYKPVSLSDYIYLSEIILDEKGKKQAISFLEKQIKQNKNFEKELNHQKNKISFLLS